MLTAFQDYFLENRKQRQRQYNERQDKHPEQEIIHTSLEMEDHVGGKGESVLPVAHTTTVIVLANADLSSICRLRRRRVATEVRSDTQNR